MSATARIGVDVGGIFTDLVLHDPARDLVATGKRLTTPDDPSRAILEGVRRLLEETGLAPGALLTTAGFRASIEIGRETRYELYDLFIEPAAALVPRHRRLEIPGRIDVHGEELLPLDEGAVRAAMQMASRCCCPAARTRASS